MTNEILLRYFTSLLVLISLPPLILLLKELMEQHSTRRKSDVVEFALFVIYNTFLISGLFTLYINTQIQFFHAQAQDYTRLALIRNIIKHIGVAFVSWRLFFITKGGESK